MIRSAARPCLAWPLLACACLALVSCRQKQPDIPAPGDAIRKGASNDADARRRLFAQIVEDADPNAFVESATIEGAPYKYFMKAIAATTHDRLRKQTNDELAFQELMAQPGMYRGQVVTLNRGVVLEVHRVKLPEGLGLPEGYTTIGAVFVDSAREVYALRILCPPGSKLYERLEKGINEDAYPVARVTGYFMKLYARRTADPKEPPWRRPLLICPEPEFSQAVEPRHVADDMRESGTDKLLPSERIDTPGVEERLVLELNAGRGAREATVCVGDKVAGQDLKAFVAEAVSALRKRLPPPQQAAPAAVILIASQASRTNLDAIISALKAAGVQRNAVKREK